MRTRGRTAAAIRRFVLGGSGVCLGWLLFFVPNSGTTQETGDAASCRPTERAEERERMVRLQIQNRGVTHPAVLDAMRTVPRHCFVPATLQADAYRDHPLPIGQGQTISQPYIVAFMTELLNPDASHRILEIGTGSGYQTAVLARIANEVYSVEILPALALEAGDRLRRLGTRNVHIRHGDGNEGWAEHAPFDGILVTAAAEEIPPELIRQLKPGGRMVVPVGGARDVQRLTVLTKDLSGSVSTLQGLPVRFVPLRKGP